MVFTRKALILIIVILIVIGIAALANTTAAWGTAGEDTQSATCSEETLTVDSHIGVEQGYVATATSYDASVCGLCTCECEHLYNRLIPGHYTLAPNILYTTGVLLSELSIESNMNTMNVSFYFEVNGTGFYHNNYHNYPTVIVLEYENGGTTAIAGPGQFTSTSPANLDVTLTGIGGHSPYFGYIDIVLQTYNDNWEGSLTPGGITVTSYFTISPKNDF